MKRGKRIPWTWVFRFRVSWKKCGGRRSNQLARRCSQRWAPRLDEILPNECYPKFHFGRPDRYCNWVLGFLKHFCFSPEVFSWLEFLLLSKFVEHFRRDCGRMRSENVFHGFFFAPVVAVAFGIETTVTVDVFHALEVICWWIVQSRCLETLENCWEISFYLVQKGRKYHEHL